ncbi:hypothetical protein PR202_ga19052 [Eleusine coracana subsp. coracana]|uniref:Nuclear transcription factor Y subunit n=1 Tax=Eleusine coracana subsp. coracana TaxID=191504 RepID=A0AAV5CUJ4_ELECO|nr:hypothetical protein PR202_ga19052 [Eleusine coracana subsp. coracana]
MATSREPTSGGEPPPSDPSQRRHPTSRISHIVRTYLDLSSSSKKRCASLKSLPKADGQEAHAAEDEMGAGMTGEPSAQPSRLLRELGIRVSRYTHEERRDIILRYMQKRSGRQVINRAASKIPSRQALAERRRRGVGGKFLGKEDPQTADKPEEKVEEEPELPPEVISNSGGVPIVGLVFESEEKAYEYYNEYLLNGSNEAQCSNRKKFEVARRRNDLESKKRKKTRKDTVQPDETAVGPRGELNITPGSIQSEPRNASNQFLQDQLMQGHYVLGHNFELGSSQNLHDNLNQFDQASISTLQQQPFPGNGQLSQGYPGDMHALQFVGANPQIDHQSDDQGQSSIPVWDFL